MTRLTKFIEFMNVLHEFIKSTAIAAITLVSLNGPKQLAVTVIFLWGIFVVYFDHETVFDRLEVADLLEEVPFWPHYPSRDKHQCNRLLRVLTGRSKRIQVFMTVVLFVEFVLASAAWGVLRFSWSYDIGMKGDVEETVLGCQDAVTELGMLFCTGNRSCMDLITNVQSEEPTSELGVAKSLYEKIMSFLLKLFVDDPEELEQMGMQVMFYSLMWLLHMLFSAIYVYETQLSMPFHYDAQGEAEVWNLNKHGVPLRFRFFGLPSIWFATPKDYSKLLCYVNGVRPHKVFAIFPEELAMLLLKGDDDMHEEVALTLKTAKYCKVGQTQKDSDPDPEALLDLDVWIFQEWQDTAMRGTGMRGHASVGPGDVKVGVYMHLHSEVLRSADRRTHSPHTYSSRTAARSPRLPPPSTEHDEVDVIGVNEFYYDDGLVLHGF